MILEALNLYQRDRTNTMTNTGHSNQRLTCPALRFAGGLVQCRLMRKRMVRLPKSVLVKVSAHSVGSHARMHARAVSLAAHASCVYRGEMIAALDLRARAKAPGEPRGFSCWFEFVRTLVAKEFSLGPYRSCGLLFRLRHDDWLGLID